MNGADYYRVICEFELCYFSRLYVYVINVYLCFRSLF